MEKKYIGFLVLLILAASFTIILSGQIRIDVQNTKTIYKVWEGVSWNLAATESVNLFDGTKKMRASSREISYTEDSGIITIHRSAQYKDGISVYETYVFDSSVSDVELVPVSHETICLNCVGKILQFEFRDIKYDGETKDITSPFSFGHNMKLTWQDGAYRAKVYQQIISDKIILRYRPKRNTEFFYTRLFDPPASAIATNITILFPVNNTAYVTNGLDLNWTSNVSNISWAVYSLDGGANSSAIFFGNTATNITLIGLSEGPHNISIWINVSNGSLSNGSIARSNLVNFSIRPPLNATLCGNLTNLAFNVNWSKQTVQLNFSNATVVAGNFTWNFTDLNLSIYPSTIDCVYEITNRRINNVTVSIKIDRTALYFNLTYNSTGINTTTRNIFNITANSTKKINLTLNLINISQTYRNWNLTINNENWTVTVEFNDTEAVI